MEVRRVYAKSLGIDAPCEGRRHDSRRTTRRRDSPGSWGTSNSSTDLASSWSSSATPWRRNGATPPTPSTTTSRRGSTASTCRSSSFCRDMSGQLCAARFPGIPAAPVRCNSLVPYLVVNALYLMPKFAFPGMTINALPEATRGLLPSPALPARQPQHHALVPPGHLHHQHGLSALCITHHLALGGRHHDRRPDAAFQESVPSPGTARSGRDLCLGPFVLARDPGEPVSAGHRSLEHRGLAAVFPGRSLRTGLRVTYLPLQHLATAAAGVFMCYALARAWRIPDTWAPWHAVARNSFPDLPAVRIRSLGGAGHVAPDTPPQRAPRFAGR